MIYTLFFSRFRGDMTEAESAEYQEHAQRLLDEARQRHPGFVDLKKFVADDGERVTIVRFSDKDSQQGWRTDPVHIEGQKRGRSSYYEEYRIVICEEVRSHAWSRTRHEVES